MQSNKPPVSKRRTITYTFWYYIIQNVFFQHIFIFLGYAE